MSSISELARDVEVKFEELWTKLIPHVVPEAIGDAQALVADVKGQASQLVQEAVADGAKDVSTAVGDGEQVAKDAEQALTAPVDSGAAPAKGTA